MKILLTGAAGFIGSHLAGRLIARGDEIIGIDCFDSTLYPRQGHIENLAAIASPERFRFHEASILDRPLFDALFDSERFDAVVHLAALAGVRPSIREPARYHEVNLTGTLNLLEAARHHGMRRFIFASSSSVYGARHASEVPFRETDAAIRPASPYAATKRAGELYCSTYSDLFGIATTALRFFTVYGPRGRPDMAIRKFAESILARRPIPVFGDGNTARDYTYVDDILAGIVAAVDRCGGGQHRVYNLGGSRTTTLAGLIGLLERNLGESAILDRQPEQPGDVPITYADVSRASADLGYAPTTGIEEGIDRFCRWLRAR